MKYLLVVFIFVCSFVLGYWYNYHITDYTMSDKQAQKYCIGISTPAAYSFQDVVLEYAKNPKLWVKLHGYKTPADRVARLNFISH